MNAFWDGLLGHTHTCTHTHTHIHSSPQKSRKENNDFFCSCWSIVLSPKEKETGNGGCLWEGCTGLQRPVIGRWTKLVAYPLVSFEFSYLIGLIV